MTRPRCVTLPEWLDRRAKAKAGKEPFEEPVLKQWEVEDLGRFKFLVGLWVKLAWFESDTPFLEYRLRSLVRPDFKVDDREAFERFRKWNVPHEFMMLVKNHRLQPFREHCAKFSKFASA